MPTFDLIIIGGGAGAFAAAIAANELGAKTLMVNSGLPLGGTCVNVGCVPSKYLLNVGELVFKAKNHELNAVSIPDVHFDFAKAIESELLLVGQLRAAKYTAILPHLAQVTFIEGKAKFISSDEIEVQPTGQKVKGQKFIIATGSTATRLPVAGLDEVGYITHIEALVRKPQPKRLLIIGSGPLGLEFAQMFNNFGTKVNVLVRGGQILKETEPEIAEALDNYLSRDGISFWKHTKVIKVVREGNDKVVVADVNGQEMEFRADEILLATGKTPNTDNLGLENAEVKTNEAQAILVNDFYQTSASHIYAVGDVIDKPLRLETTAGKEGTYATTNALTQAQKMVDYRHVPYAVFTYPAVAGVGTRGQGESRVLDFKDVPKAQVIKDTRGVIKMVVQKADRKVLGIHLVAPHAAEIINEAMYILKAGMTVGDILQSLPVFPTLSESIKIVAQSFVSDISKLSCCT